jgi:hypothetical protein
VIYGKRIEAKKKNQGALDKLLKLWLNSLYGSFAMHAPVFICGVVETSAVEYLEKVHGVELDLKLDDHYHLVSYRKAGSMEMYQTVADSDPAKEPIQDCVCVHTQQTPKSSGRRSN